MFDLTKQSKNRGIKPNWKVKFSKSTEKSRRENIEMREQVDDLKHQMLKVEQVLIERGIKY